MCIRDRPIHYQPLRVNASKKRRRMLRVLSYNKELETEKLMKEKDQKFRDDFKGIDRAKITKTRSIPRNNRQHSHQEAGHK